MLNYTPTSKLTNYVSNLDKDIYLISKLPEEVIATIFAYVSRSPKSFRENLLTVTEEKAEQFHEKWVLNYGHASVAELASVHIGIERVSRLFSALLERTNPYISPIEYSQRYQKPNKGNFYTPSALSENLKQKYKDYQDSIYDTYSKLYSGLVDYLSKITPIKENERESAYKSRIDKIAFEDARYILTLSVHTNLGITINARACEDMLGILLSSEYLELRVRGEQIKEEVLQELPTLVKYARENDFIIKSRQTLQNIASTKISPELDTKSYPISNVCLTDFTTSGSKDPENEALDIILPELLYPYLQKSIKEIEKNIKSISKEEKINTYKELMSRLKSHDNPSFVFEKINYSFELLMSEACWHQLLRHRKVGFSWQYPSVDNGYILPPNIEKANLAMVFKKGIDKSRDMYGLIQNASSLEDAHYVVTNAHIRRTRAYFSLWELYHLINLRMTQNAQWEIRELVGKIAKEVSKVHNSLVEPALDRLYKRKSD